MQRKPNSEQTQIAFKTLPNDLLTYSFRFLTLKELPVIARVSNQWRSSTANVDILLKDLVVNTLKQSGTPIDAKAFEAKAKEQGKKIDWKKFYPKLRQYQAAQKEYQEIKEIENEIEEMHENNRFAAQNVIGSEPAAGICRKDTCLAGCCCSGICSTMTYLITMFACKEATCLFTVAFGCIGFNLGFAGRTYQLERRVRQYREGNAATPLLNDSFFSYSNHPPETKEDGEEDESNNSLRSSSGV